MNHFDNSNEKNKEKEVSSDDSNEESFQFFQVSNEKNFLKNKRKNSIDDYYSISQKSIKEKNEQWNNKENNINFEKKEKDSENNYNSNSEDNQQKIKKKKKKKKPNNDNINNNFKAGKSKQICQFYINGACKKGENCPYSHDAEQIHKKELCKFYLSGKCAKGENCLYSHDLSEIPCKFFHGLGFCENFQNCPFSHERLDEEGIKEFIKINEDFLKETKKKYGRTNMDEFYNKYLNEKKGGEDFIMIPDFIKKEDKEKEINGINDKIPLGIVVMSNNNKIINELKNFYNIQNLQNIQNKLNNIFDNGMNNNKINNNFFNSGNNKINKNNLINNNNLSNNNNKIISKMNQIIPIQNNINNISTSIIQNNINNILNIEKENNKKINNIKDNIINEKNKLKSNKAEIEEKKLKNIDNNKFESKKEEIKDNCPNVEINPFMNPMMISDKDINNLF